MEFTKKEIIEKLRNQLGKNLNSALKALQIIYEFQTEDEKESESTCYENGMGFTGLDAPLLTSFASQVNRGRSLSEKQTSILFKMMPKYAGQIFINAVNNGIYQKNGRKYVINY